METKIEEIWKDIPGYEGLYKASNYGKVKSLTRLDSMNRPVAGGPLKEILKDDRYFVVGLYNYTKSGSKFKSWYVHRLIISTFTGELPKSIDHKNNIKTDNRLSNLEIVTQRENIHRYRRGARTLPIGVSIGRNKFKKYVAHISFKGKQHRLGAFHTVDEARICYENKLKQVDGTHQYKY